MIRETATVLPLIRYNRSRIVQEAFARQVGVLDEKLSELKMILHASNS